MYLLSHFRITNALMFSLIRYFLCEVVYVDEDGLPTSQAPHNPQREVDIHHAMRDAVEEIYGDYGVGAVMSGLCGKNKLQLMPRNENKMKMGFLSPILAIFCFVCLFVCFLDFQIFLLFFLFTCCTIS